MTGCQTQRRQTRETHKVRDRERKSKKGHVLTARDAFVPATIGYITFPDGIHVHVITLG